MLADRMRMAAAGRGVLDVADVFHVNTRTGNGSTATVTGGFEPSLSITKARDTTTGWRWVTTPGSSLDSSSAGALATEATGVIAFTSTGMTLGADADYNANTVSFVDYLLADAPGFLGVVSYTGDGTSSQNIPHSLGQAPGMIIVKRTSSSSDWAVYHRSVGETGYLGLNTTSATITSSTRWNDTAPTDSQFTVGSTLNTAADYDAYLFAHDTSDAGIIQCGTFTIGGGGTATVTTGWQPQFAIIKYASATSGWFVVDEPRGWSDTNSGPLLQTQSSGAEGSASAGRGTNSDGFDWIGSAGVVAVYIAIRAEA